MPSSSSASTTTRRCSRCSRATAGPYVLTWGVDPMRRHPSIGFDNRAATFEMTRHLIGTRPSPLRPAQRARPRATTARTERGAGVRAALAAGRPGARRALRALRPDRPRRRRRAMMRELLALDRRGRPRWSSTNDVFAVGGMLACREARRAHSRTTSRSPACDNTDLGATQTPPLTSIRTPIVEIGRRRGRAADRAARGPAARGVPGAARSSWCSRGSTAPPRR